MTEGANDQEYFLEAFYAQMMVTEHRQSMDETVVQYRSIADAIEYMLEQYGAVPALHDYQWSDLLDGPVVTFYIAGPPKKWIHHVTNAYKDVIVCGTIFEEQYDNLNEDQLVDIGKSKESMWSFLQMGESDA